MNYYFSHLKNLAKVPKAIFQVCIHAGDQIPYYSKSAFKELYCTNTLTHCTSRIVSRMKGTLSLHRKTYCEFGYPAPLSSLLYRPFQGGTSVVILSPACFSCQFRCCFHILCVKIKLVSKLTMSLVNVS